MKDIEAIEVVRVGEAWQATIFLYSNDEVTSDLHSSPQAAFNKIMYLKSL